MFFAVREKALAPEENFLKGGGKRSRRQVEWEMGRGQKSLPFLPFSHIGTETTHVARQISFTFIGTVVMATCLYSIHADQI